MFCQKCGKEISEDAEFCQYCGYKIKKDTVQNSESKTGCFLVSGVLIIIFVFGILFNSVTENTKTQTENKASCPSVAEMEEAISQYKEGKIIQRFEPELNAVYISPMAENQLLYDDLRVLGYITACYSGYAKGNNLHWVEIYSVKTHKKIGKFSENSGFEIFN